MMSSLRVCGVLTQVSLVGLLALGACGGGGDAPKRDAGSGDAASVADGAGKQRPDLAGTPGHEPQTKGLDQVSPEAGFSIHWPRGCDRVQESFTGEATYRAGQEFIYYCAPRDGNGLQLQMNVLKGAHTEAGQPPHPRFVVAIIEQRLKEFKGRIQRQLPLEMPGIQGVDVQAAAPGGTGEIWLRGLLAGTDVFVLMAWNKDGGVFNNPAIQDFFDSFRTR